MDESCSILFGLSLNILNSFFLENVLLYSSKYISLNTFRQVLEWGSYMVWEINIGVFPRLEFDNIMFITCLGYDFYILMVHLSLYAIPLLIYDVMYDITTIP